MPGQAFGLLLRFRHDGIASVPPGTVLPVEPGTGATRQTCEFPSGGCLPIPPARRNSGQLSPTLASQRSTSCCVRLQAYGQPDTPGFVGTDTPLVVPLLRQGGQKPAGSHRRPTIGAGACSPRARGAESSVERLAATPPWGGQNLSARLRARPAWRSCLPTGASRGRQSRLPARLCARHAWWSDLPTSPKGSGGQACQENLPGAQKGILQLDGLDAQRAGRATTAPIMPLAVARPAA